MSLACQHTEHSHTSSDGRSAVKPLCSTLALMGVPLPGTQLRKLLGEEEWEDSLQVRKDKEHFIFTVQSTGAPCITVCKAACTVAGSVLRES